MADDGSVKTPYVTKRGDAYHYRRQIPADLASALKQSFWSKSLGRDHNEALVAVADRRE